MRLDGFIKQTSSLSGSEKAAILLGELGLFTTEHLMRYFTDDEIKKINRGFVRIGRNLDASVENQVLEEAVAFGISKKHLPQTALFAGQNSYYGSNASQNDYSTGNDIAYQGTGVNTDDLAQAISQWLREE